MNPSLLLAFWGVTVLLIVVPGPDWAFILATGARDRMVLPAVAGLLLGYLALTAFVAAGVGGLIGRSSLLVTALTVAGAAYLVRLGIRTLRNPAGPQVDSHHSPRSMTWCALAGIGVSGLNPKGLLVFLAMLPQFTDAHGSWPLPVQLGALGLVFVGSCGLFYTGLGFGSRAVLAAAPTLARVVSRVSGAAMIAVGLALLIERLRATG
ncbi:LysE family translocator [Nocardia terpenica]|uniref:LysE family translocator n=1 Tax=Nocardia terpenica TaxID=455432 RepID=UPI002FE0346A